MLPANLSGAFEGYGREIYLPVILQTVYAKQQVLMPKTVSALCQ